MSKYSYSIFGLNVISDLEFPELISGNGHPYDLTITEGSVPDNLSSSVEYRGNFQYAGDEFLFKSKNSGKFLLRNSEEIIFERYKDSTYEDIRVLLLSVVIGIFLHKKEKFPLHASAVEVNGKAILFAGQCGIGKSTFAAGLIARGTELISDDITVIEEHSNRYFAVPSFPQVKLWPDSMGVLGFDPEKFSKLRPKVNKRQMLMDKITEEQIEIDTIYFLARNNIQQNKIVTLTVPQKISLLENNTFRIGHLKQIGNTKKHFDTCCELVKNVKIKKIDRPHGKFELNKTIGLILDDLKNN